MRRWKYDLFTGFVGAVGIGGIAAFYLAPWAAVAVSVFGAVLGLDREEAR